MAPLTVKELRRELDEVLEQLRHNLNEDFRKEIGEIVHLPGANVCGVLQVPKRIISNQHDLDGVGGPKRTISNGQDLTRQVTPDSQPLARPAPAPEQRAAQRPLLSHVKEGTDERRLSTLEGKQLPLMLSRDAQGRPGSSRDIEAMRSSRDIEAMHARSPVRAAFETEGSVRPSKSSQQYSIVSSACCDYGQSAGAIREEPKRPPRGGLGTLLHSQWWKSFIYFCIFVNSVLLGFETDYASQHAGKEHMTLAIAEMVFWFIFTLELVLRLCHNGPNKWRKSIWNWFDLLLVVGQLVEVLAVHFRIRFAGQETEAFIRGDVSGDHITVFRILRVFRGVRFSNLRFFQELREMLMSVIGSVKSFGWVVIMISLMNYIFSIIVCQLTVRREGAREIVDLDRYFGGLARTMLTNFECITGGLSWDEAVRPLIEISPVVGLLFCFYIAFCVLSILNVITGTFVQRATKEARVHEDNMTANLIRDVFMKTDEEEQHQVIVTVEGAGIPGASHFMNGKFKQNGTYGGRPKFYHVDGDAIMYFDEYWKINDEDNTTEWCYQAPASYAKLPAPGAWTMDGCKRGDAHPPPTVSCSQEISQEAFESKMHTREMQEYFSYMGIDMAEGAALFDLLDVDRSGAISAEELVDGCLRVRGEAKALDLSVLSNMTNIMRLQQERLVSMTEEIIARFPADNLSRSTTISKHSDTSMLTSSMSVNGLTGPRRTFGKAIVEEANKGLFRQKNSDAA